MSRRVDHLLAGFAEGDAISWDALRMQEACREQGLDSTLYAPPAFTESRAAGRVRSLADYAGRPGDVAILHDALAPEAAQAFFATPAHRVFRYHNITPADFFRGFDDSLAERLSAARAALRPVAEAADAVWSDSAFNAAELAGWAVAKSRVLPLLFREEPPRTPDPVVAARTGGGLANILFVGRLAPNKRIEELILAFHWYHRAVNPRSRLIVAGSERSCPRYAAMLRLLAHALNLPNVCFEGFASPEGLAALYAGASLFATASAHEGYCLPLVEAMAAGVPVLARRTGGMPEALGGAGLLYEELTAPQLGELMGEAIGNADLRARLLASQAARMVEIRARKPADELARLLAELD